MYATYALSQNSTLDPLLLAYIYIYSLRHLFIGAVPMSSDDIVFTRAASGTLTRVRNQLLVV